MENAFEWGMEWIIALQGLGGPIAESIFYAITFMGEEYFYLIVVPIIYWSVDAAIGARVGFAYLISAFVNLILKVNWLPEPQPRPCDLVADVCNYHFIGYGMPSGHAQSSIFVWGVLAAQVKRRWFWVLAMSMAFLIGFSRIILGAHFPHQVLAGWAVGAVLLVIFLLLDPRVEAAVGRLALAPQLLVTLGIPLLLAFVYPHDDTVGAAAVMAGFGSGLVLSRRYVPFNTKGLWWQRAIRAVIGLVVLLALYVGMSALFPGEEAGEAAYFSFRFIRYGILGLWIALGAPWLFSVLHLLQEPQVESQPEHV